MGIESSQFNAFITFPYQLDPGELQCHQAVHYLLLVNILQHLPSHSVSSGSSSIQLMRNLWQTNCNEDWFSRGLPFHVPVTSRYFPPANHFQTW